MATLSELKATIFQHGNYGGKNQALGIGQYNMADLTIGNEQLSSLKIPLGLQVTLYQHANFTGETRTYTADVSFTQDFNDQTSSIVVEPVVTIYQQDNYAGASQALRVGQYNIADLTIGNDQLSSLRVPDGMQATLYQHANFQGNTRTYTSDIPFTEGFNEQTSSIRIELVTTPEIIPTGTPPSGPPPGTTTPPEAEQAATRTEAEVYTGVGSSLGGGYTSNPPDEIAGQPLSQLIASGAVPQYDLMVRLQSKVQDGTLTMDKATLGDYGVLVDLVGMLLDILAPIRNVQIQFAKGSPGMIGEPGQEISENPTEDNNLATPEDHALKISGDVTLFTNKAARLEYADFFHYKGKPNCSFKFIFTEDMGIGTFLPGVPLIQGLKLASPTIIAATASTLYDPNLDSGINEGFNFFGNLKIAESDDAGIRFIGDILDVRELAVHAAVDTSGATPQYLLEAAVQRDITIIDGKNFKLRFTRSDVGIYVKGQPPEPSIAMSNDLVVTLIEKGKENHLVFTGGVKIEAESITGSFTMNGTGRSPEGALSGTVQNTGEWREPFGIPGVIIRQFAVQVGFTYLFPWVDNVGVHANMKIGDVDGSVSILVDTNDPDQFVLAGSTDRITIIQIMSAMSPVTFVAYQALPSAVRSAMNKAVDIALEDVKVSIVPSATSIGGVHFRDEGVTIAGRLAVFGWQASMYLNVDTFDGITAAADMDPLNILNVLKVTGAGTDPAPKLRLRISTADTPYLYISAKIEFLALTQELQVEVGENGMLFIFNRSLGNILTTNLRFSYKDYNFDANGKINFNLNASFNTVFGKITLVDIGFNAEATIRAGQDAGFFASLSGGFRFYGKTVTFPTLTLDVPPSDFQAIYDQVIKRIEDKALDIFGDVFETLEEWANAVKDGTIVFAGEVATVAKDVYKASKEAAAKAYKTLNKGAREAAKGISQAYNISARETAKVLKGAEYAANEVADAMQDAFKLTVDGAADALKYAGYGVNEVGNALKTAYNATANATAKALKAAGYTVNQVGDALKSAYNATADTTAKALKFAGYGVNEVGNFLKSGYNLTGKALQSALEGAGYAAKQVEGFLKDVGEWFGDNMNPTKW